MRTDVPLTAVIAGPRYGRIRSKNVRVVRSAIQFVNWTAVKTSVIDSAASEEKRSCYAVGKLATSRTGEGRVISYGRVRVVSYGGAGVVSRCYLRAGASLRDERHSEPI